MPAELTKAVQQCDCCCRYEKLCTYVKAAHVSLYGWICDDCYKYWVGE